MLAAALIVFREVLEAAIVVSIVMAATQGMPHRKRWVSLGIGGGIAGAGIVAAMTGTLASIFNGAGQDIIDALILFTATALIGWHVVWMNSHGRKMAQDLRSTAKKVAEGERHMSILAIVVGLAVLREGSEVVLMLQGLWTTGSHAAMLGGGVLGLIAGAIAGAVMYFGFVALPIGRVFSLTNGILVLIAAGMAAHAANFLAQAGLVSSLGGRLWDSSAFLPDQSPLGQLLAALIGYIARPNGIEVLFYATTILIVVALTRRAQRQNMIAAALAAFLIGGSILSPRAALASPPPIIMQVDADSVDQNQNANGALFGLRSEQMLGNMWGFRPWINQYGLTFNLQETSEVLGNITGGIHQGFDYDGLTQMAVQMDTQRAFGFYGGTFNVSALQIHGRSLSADNLDTLQTASGIEADRATRLWELWYDQKFLQEDRLDVKIGQQSLDQEFMASSNANLFVNTMFGWPMLPSADLPGGGPAYPLSALGVRTRVKPDNNFTVLAGVFNGSPTPVNSNGSQEANASGTKFPLDGGALAIAEIQYAYPALGAMVSPDETKPLSGTYKLGIWYDTENFADEEMDNTGVSLANTAATSGIPLQHHGDYAIYAVADQMIWNSDDFDDRTLNVFARAMGTPLSDRNLIDFSLNAGLTLHEPIPLRDDDTIGVGMGYAHVSNRVAAFEKDGNFYGAATPVQSGEAYIEVTYQYQVTPWWQIQPDFQYVFNPGAGVANPDTGQRVANEAVIGVRTNIAF